MTPSTTQSKLQETLNDLQIRSVVEETVKSMLIDVELAQSLQEELERQEQQARLEKQVMAAKIALQEARLVEEQQEQGRKSLADELLRELWTLSQELGNLKRWKKQHEGTVEQRDELAVQLLQAQDEIQLLRSRPMVMQEAGEGQDAKPTPAATTTTAPTLKSVVENESSKMPPVESSASPTKEFPVKIEEVPDAKPTELETNVITLPEVATLSEIVAESGSIPAVALVMEDDEDVPLLETFAQPILLHVFSFLDALEIVNLAQVNIALYSRVDSLFGMSEEGGPPVPTEIETTTVQPASAAAAAAALVPAQPPQATIVQLPPPFTPQKKPPPPSSQPPQAKPGIISLFQTGKNSQQTGGARTFAPSATAAASSQSKASSSKPAALSAAMANSMAEKLTDKEINAIISMTEKLNKRNKEVDVLTQQNLELNGKLDGTEAVKEFLVQKVREMEQAMTRSKEQDMKTTQQISSDQEVIAFLDSRVQELERAERVLEAERKSLDDQLVKERLQKEKKITVLSDMLQYERERGQENERDWRATRKVLVKEVKSCRATITTLQAERDGLQQQVEQLKRALNGVAMMSNGSPMRGHMH